MTKQEVKQKVLEMYASGVAVHQIYVELGVPISTIRWWLNKAGVYKSPRPSQKREYLREWSERMRYADDA